MKRVVVISYTEIGRQLNSRLVRSLIDAGDVAVSCRCKEEFELTGELLRQEWPRTDAFIFVGAMGIAVRHIAPFLQDKVHDPAVLVADELGQYVIPVLSGHIGGGVELARRTARMLGAQAVITTATDVEGRFAVDVFARDNHLLITNPAAIKEISAAVLKGDKVELQTRLPIMGDVPAGVSVCKDILIGGTEPAVDLDGACPEGDGPAVGVDETCPGEAEHVLSRCAGGTEDVLVRYKEKAACRLSLKPYIIGIGCKKGKSADELAGFLEQVCRRYGIDQKQIAALASIDVKKEELGIWELSRRLSAVYEIFTAKELEQVEETVTSSAFVRQTVGVDNVCERSALCLAKRLSGSGNEYGEDDNDSGGKGGHGGFVEDEEPEKETCAASFNGMYELIVGKQAQDGMTVAVARFCPAAYRWHEEQGCTGAV